MAKRESNPGALHVRMSGLIEAYGFEATLEACARVCEREAVRSGPLPRVPALRRMARRLRALAADAREVLEEGLAMQDTRVIGCKTRFVLGVPAPRAHGPRVAYVVVTAVRKSGIRKAHGAPRLTTAEDVRAAGGLTKYDLVEFDAYAKGGTWLYTDDLPAIALASFGHLA
ncbi:MAG: hypothetical protein ACLQVI_30655 [Polyangiaceae bacterium]